MFLWTSHTCICRASWPPTLQKGYSQFWPYKWTSTWKCVDRIYVQFKFIRYMMATFGNFLPRRDLIDWFFFFFFKSSFFFKFTFIPHEPVGQLRILWYYCNCLKSYFQIYIRKIYLWYTLIEHLIKYYLKSRMGFKNKI